MSEHSYITDPDDFCRTCKGSGAQSYTSPTGANVTEPCYLCGGSGVSSVRLTKQLAAE